MSVFSHFAEEMEVAWLAELVRLLKSTGHLYITFNGQHVLNEIPQSFPEEAIAAYYSTGFAYFSNIDDGILPEWYQTSLQTYAFVKSRLPGNSTAVSHESGGCLGW